MGFRMRRSRLQGATVGLALVASLALAACGAGGGGGGSGTTRDPAGSAAAVDDGITALQDALSAPTPPPFATMADIATQFQTAAGLDPENPNAAFFGGLGQLIFFLDGTDAKLFIGKLGWDDFRQNDADFQGFINAIGSAVTNATGTGPFTFPVKNPDDPIATWQGGQLSMADLIQFLTVTLPGQLNAAADKLGTIPPDWSYTISIQIGFLGDGGGGAQAPQNVRSPMDTSEAVDVRLDYTDTMALRAAFSAMAGVLSAPGIWNFTGLDQFLADHTTDGVLGDIPEADIKAYFMGGQVLSKNQAGLERTLGSLIAAVDSADKAITSLRAEQASQRDQSHDLLAINGGLISGALSYDDEGEVISYGLTALQLTAQDVKAALKGNASIGVYQPVAFV
ncbi:MAG TPA: hypothetical protein VF678_14275, partial [bacterium]